MKLNELVCPSCGLKCMVSASYTTCASCNTFFYANQSRSVDNPLPMPAAVRIIWPQLPPPVSPWRSADPIWVVPIDGAPPPWGPNITFGIGGTVTTTDSTQYQVMN